MSISGFTSRQWLHSFAASAYGEKAIKVALCFLDGASYTGENLISEWLSTEVSGDGYERFTFNSGSDLVIDEETGEVLISFQAAFSVGLSGYTYDSFIAYIEGSDYPLLCSYEDPEKTVNSGDEVIYAIDLKISQANYPVNTSIEPDPYWSSTRLLVTFEEDYDTDEEPGESGYYKMNNALVFPRPSAVITTKRSKFGSKSLELFNANSTSTGYSFRVTQGVDLNFYDQDFTIECYAYFLGAIPGGRATLISGSGDDLNAMWSIHIIDPFTDGNFVFRASFNTSDGGSVQLSPTVKPPIQRFFHLAVTRSGQSFRFFVDGQNINTVQFGVPVELESSYEPILIGNRYVTFLDRQLDAFNGYIDSVRITHGVSRYIDNFVPPSRRFYTGE